LLHLFAVHPLFRRAMIGALSTHVGTFAFLVGLQDGLRYLPSCGLWLGAALIYYAVTFDALQLPSMPHRVWIAAGYTFGTCLLTVTHLGVMCSDPGVVAADATVEDDVADPRYCAFCPDSPWKPPRATHCSQCDVCIFRRHHHCNYMSNCIGFRNQKLFIQMLVYAGLMACVSMVVLLLAMFAMIVAHSSTIATWVWSVACQLGLAASPGSTPTGSTNSTLPTSASLSPYRDVGIASVLRCLSAAYLCSKAIQEAKCRLREQWSFVSTNCTPLEQTRMLFGAPPPSRYAMFKAIFGPRWWLWALPVPSAGDPDLSEKVFRRNPFSRKIEEAPTETLSPVHHSLEKPRSNARTLQKKGDGTITTDRAHHGYAAIIDRLSRWGRLDTSYDAVSFELEPTAICLEIA